MAATPHQQAPSRRAEGRPPRLGPAPPTAAIGPATGVGIVLAVRPQCVREVVMGVVDVDPLTVLPVTAASASAASARATDLSPDRVERRAPLRSLTSRLASVRRLLERCQEATTRPVPSSDSARYGLERSAGWGVCQRCPGVPLTCSDDVCRCARRERYGPTRLRPPGVGRINHGRPAGRTDTGRAVCLPHDAAVLPEAAHLAVVTAPRPDRAVLMQIVYESPVSSRRSPRLGDGHGRPHGG